MCDASSFYFFLPSSLKKYVDAYVCVTFQGENKKNLGRKPKAETGDKQ